jgi:hypothetical protein
LVATLLLLTTLTTQHPTNHVHQIIGHPWLIATLLLLTATTQHPADHIHQIIGHARLVATLLLLTTAAQQTPNQSHHRISARGLAAPLGSTTAHQAAQYTQNVIHPAFLAATHATHPAGSLTLLLNLHQRTQHLLCLVARNAIFILQRLNNLFHLALPSQIGNAQLQPTST